MAQPLPTENNLMTEEGFSNSFHFYGGGTMDNRKSNRYPQMIHETEAIDEEVMNDFMNNSKKN